MLDHNRMLAGKSGPYPHSKPLPDPKKSPLEQRGKYSYYLLPISTSLMGGSNGNSRRGGDASVDVQKKAIDTLISESKQHGLSIRETAHVLAIAYVESGFNPDAAAGTSSACGLGQFTYDTGTDYGLTYSIFTENANHFDITANADALVRLYLKNKKTAIARGNAGRQLEERIYQYHHDGKGMKDRETGDGLKISKTRVLPITDNIEKVLNNRFTGIHVDPARCILSRKKFKRVAEPVREIRSRSLLDRVRSAVDDLFRPPIIQGEYYSAFMPVEDRPSKIYEYKPKPTRLRR